MIAHICPIVKKFVMLHKKELSEKLEPRRKKLKSFLSNKTGVFSVQRQERERQGREELTQSVIATVLQRGREKCVKRFKER